MSFYLFNVFGPKPALVILGIGNRIDKTPKDTVLNTKSSGELVINTLTEELVNQMVTTCMKVPPPKQS